MNATLHDLAGAGPRSLATQVAAGRVVLAAGALAAPERGVRLLGVDTGTARRVTWLTRMLGVRDAVLGLGGLVALRRGTDATPWLVAGAVCDAADAVALAAALRSGRLGGPVPALVVPVAAGGALVGLVAAAGLRRG